MEKCVGGGEGRCREVCLGCGVGKGRCGGVGKCWGRCGKVCWGVGVRGSVERCGKVCWRGVGKCVGVWRSVERGVGESVLGSPCLPPHFPTSPFTSHTPQPTFQHFPIPHHLHLPSPHSNTLSHTSPNTSSHPHLPLPPPHPNTFPYTSPHNSLYLPRISLYLPHIPTPFSTLPHTSIHISLHLSHTSQNPPHSILTPYTIPHFKKIMLKCFYIRFKPEKYVGTIVPMPPVKSVKKQNPMCQQRVNIFS